MSLKRSNLVLYFVNLLLQVVLKII